MAHYDRIVTKTVDEWLKLRQSRIGGSEIASVIGVSPMRSRYELYQEKRGVAAPVEENFVMWMGHQLEPIVARIVEDRLGYQIIKNTTGNLIYLSKDYPFAEASPDRIAYLPHCRHIEANKAIIEIKTTQKAIDDENIPEHWICQVQWYMGITGIKKAVIAWLTQARDFGYKEIPFSESFFKLLVTEGAEFARCLEEGIEPEAVTAADVNAKYPRHIDDKYLETTSEVAIACEQYKKLNAEIKSLEEARDACAETIKVAMQDAEGIKYSGLALATYKATKDKEKFDSALFCKENPGLAAKYTKTIPGARTLRVK